MTGKIDKFLDSLDEKTHKRLKDRLIKIKKDPYGNVGVKKLRGFGEDAYRVRMGKIRIIYQIVGNEVQIIDIDYRGNIY
jgi:mRNA interferase RelE/StbE